MSEITENIRQEARRLLHDGIVGLVIGYQQGWEQGVVTPCFVTQESQVDKLVWNDRCTHNLAKYLVGREGLLTSRFKPASERPRVALVARPATLLTIVGLIQEHQFKRENLVILGIVDDTPVDLQPDVEVGRIDADGKGRAETLARIQELDKLSPSERWEWWQHEFSKCVRCYACRQVCPYCYCEECIADENQPQWIGTSPSSRNNTTWNAIRAYHLIGRCVNCGECERVCPAEIPLALLNVKMATEVQNAFGYVAGTDVEAVPALVTFKVNDDDAFIR